MPFLRDEGPPIPPASIQKFRESLAVEYGWQLVNETGREVLVVRVPKVKPDYLHELAEVAFYVGLESLRNTKDVLLVGHEKTARLEPQLLRDHIRAQGREDATVVDHLRRSLDRQYGHTFVQSPSNHQHNAFSIRIPKETVAQFTPDDVNAIREIVASLRARVLDCQYAYIVANADHERLGRRVLLELIGDAPPAQPAAEPLPPMAAPIASPATPAPTPAPAAVASAAPVHRTPFPSMGPSAHTPTGTIAPPPVFAHAAPPIAASSAAPPTPAPSAPIAVAPPPAPFAEAEITDHEEYTIVSKPKAPAPSPSSSPASPPSPSSSPSATPADITEHDTTALRRGLSETAVSDEYEIVSKPRAPAPAQAPAQSPPQAPAAEPEPDESSGKNVLHSDKEFEVFTSKPKPRAEAPAITPPGKGGFQAALGAAAPPAPARTKEYEIIGRTSVTSDPSIVSRMKLPGATPAAAPSPFAAPAPAHFQAQPQAQAPPMQPASVPLPPRVAASASSMPTADNGATIVARMAPAAPELILAQRFRDAGYEVVEGLRAQGTVFAFAAHRPNGRRVLVKRSPSFAAEEAAGLAQLVSALGADVALVVADEIKAGTRLATWGTRIEVVSPADVPNLAF